MQETTPALEQEIVDLELKLQEKRAALGQNQEADGESLLHREEVHEVVKEKIREHVPNYQPTSTPQVSSPAPSGHIPSYMLPEFKEAVQEFINMVFNGSIAEAIKEIGKTDNMALIDAFHDALTDELYGALIERKKLEVVK